MEKMLIAVDGSPASDEAVEFGLELAAEHEAAVIFVHVAPAPDVAPVSTFGMTGALPHDLSDIDRPRSRIPPPSTRSRRRRSC